jgi:hypothetical protein
MGTRTRTRGNAVGMKLTLHKLQVWGEIRMTMLGTV